MKKNFFFFCFKFPEDMSSQNKTFKLFNALSEESCYVDIFLFEKIQIESFLLNCTSECYVNYNSVNLKTNSMNFKSKLLETNAL
jgi:hypothetical protein